MMRRFMLTWMLLLVLTEVFFPFQDDIAVLTKFTPSQSEGIVLTLPPFVCPCPFFCREPLGNQISVPVSHWYRCEPGLLRCDLQVSCWLSAGSSPG